MEKFTEALIYAAEAHDGQRYGDGPYILHPLDVARRLRDAGADDETVLAGILHDVVEDTKATLDEIRERFGERVAAMVSGLTHLEGDSYRAYIAKMPEESKPVKFFDSLTNKMALASGEITGERLEKLRSRYDDNLKQLLPSVQHLTLPHGLASFVEHL